MATWSNKLSNRYIYPLIRAKKYSNQYYEDLNNYKNTPKRMDIIINSVKEG